MRIPIEILILGSFCGLIFGGFCFAVGYIKGRFDTASRRRKKSHLDNSHDSG